MKVTKAISVALATLLIPAAAYAVKIPIPVEGATLNLSFQLQAQSLMQENGAPNGTDNSYDFFIRRSRIIVNGDISQNFSYFVQVDNPNFGKYGNYTGRAIVQDAWVGWAPTGITGGTVLYIDAGILLVPFSHTGLESTTNFVTADISLDTFRMPGNALPAFRDTGIQLRGWALNKKIGFRGGFYEGYQPATPALGGAPANATTPAGALCATATPGSCVNPKRNPAIRGFVNFDIIGSEEGGWLYGAYKWGKEPILSVNVAGSYQSQAIKTPFGDLTDHRYISAGMYLNLPMTEQAELVLEATGTLNGNGSGSGNTGTGLEVNLGYRFGAFAPYVSYDYFQSGDCGGLTLDPGQATTCANAIDSADSRNFRAGLNFFFNKNLNHLNIEFAANHGAAGYGPATINNATAGYAPLALDPFVAGGPRRTFTANLRNPTFKSLLLHWNVLF